MPVLFPDVILEDTLDPLMIVLPVELPTPVVPLPPEFRLVAGAPPVPASAAYALI